MDPYSPCFCGSGKKLKWCCQDIYVEVNQAFEKEQNKQHDAASRIMQGVIEKHPGNPQAWCFHAQLMMAHNKTDEAEKSLDKAFELREDHPFALLMRASIRMSEGEIEGARVLARQAAESYDPQAKDAIGQVYEIIHEAESKRNNAIAARAALRIMVRCDPSHQQLREVLQTLYGERGPFPAVVCEDFALQSPPSNAEGERRKKWDDALNRAASSRIGSLAQAFEELTQSDSNDVAAWHNLGLTQAWLGNNVEALDAFDKYLELEIDETKAESIAALCQVLLQGYGLQQRADFKAYMTQLQLAEAEPISKWLQQMAESGKLAPIPQGEEQPGAYDFMLLEPVQEGILTTSGTPQPSWNRIIGQLAIRNNLMGISSLSEEARDQVVASLQEAAGEKIKVLSTRVLPANWSDIASKAITFPKQQGEENQKEQQKRVKGYYEDHWTHQPLTCLGGNTPVDAVGHKTYRKVLRGLILFLDQCTNKYFTGIYDFNQLRRKLGLIEGQATETEGGTESEAATNIADMGAPELSALQIEDLSDSDLETAYQTAQRLRAEELQQHFGEALIERPVTEDSVDRFPIFSSLIDYSLREKPDASLDLIDAGEKYDCENNEGKRRNDFELRRGKAHVRRKEADEASSVFSRLIERDPDNLSYHVEATRGMISLGQKDKTIQFAEAGLKEARKQNEGDAEGELMELLEAAQRM